MITANELFMTAIEHWRDAKGIGTAIIPAPLNDKCMILGVLQRVYARSPTCKTIIITTTFHDRTQISEFITQQEEDDNNEEFKNLLKDGHIQVLTYDFVKRNNFKINPFLCIWYRPETVCQEIIDYINRSKFKLIVTNKLLANLEDMNAIYKLAPILDDFKQHQVNQVRLSTPVEETQIAVNVDLDSEEGKLLTYYDNYIATSLSIFGSFEIMQQANVGNQQLNISSMQICYQIAKENGWHEHLDMSVEFNVQIDELYNPNNLKERASKTYEIIRNRGQILTDYKDKLEAIFDIVVKNSDKKILIINKRADFATQVTDYLNNRSDNMICMNYHDKVESIPAFDSNFEPIYYKSGAKKGERKMIAAQAQRTLAMTLFNENKIHVLSTNNAPDKDLNIDVDVIIITSPACENLSSYIYRLSYLNFNSAKIDLFTIYCKNTSEQRQLENKERMINHIVKNSYSDENNYDFVIAD